MSEQENLVEKDAGKLELIKKMEELEKKGIFDQDIEDDPPSKVLMPDQVDYLNKKLSSKILTKFYNHMVTKFFEKQIKAGALIVEQPEGLENLKEVKNSGVIFTCNHINPIDSYIIHKSIKPVMKRELTYRVIREGNYTGFSGFYGQVFKHCNTLPLSSNKDTMKLFIKAVETLLNKKRKILIYPEQAMWWNYKKPRPLKDGSFHFAVKYNVPVLPMFITMQETDKIGADGFPVLKYKLNIGKAIYKDSNLSNKENVANMAKQNYEVWKEIYEKTYNQKLVYTKE